MEDQIKPIELIDLKEYKEIKIFAQFDMNREEFCVKLSEITAFYPGDYGTNIWVKNVGHIRTKEKYSGFKEWMNV